MSANGFLNLYKSGKKTICKVSWCLHNNLSWNDDVANGAVTCYVTCPSLSNPY